MAYGLLKLFIQLIFLIPFWHGLIARRKNNIIYINPFLCKSLKGTPAREFSIIAVRS
jgi:hypothetical protein